MVHQNFDNNHKSFRSRAREFLIECRLCWYGVHKYRDYGVLNDVFPVLVWDFEFLTKEIAIF